jgi:hypothetical protein
VPEPAPDREHPVQNPLGGGVGRRVAAAAPGERALAEAELPGDHREHLVLEDDAGRLVREDEALTQPVDVRRHADDAVRVVADQVGLDEMPGDGARFRVRRAGPGEDHAHQPLHRVVRVAYRALLEKVREGVDSTLSPAPAV